MIGHWCPFCQGFGNNQPDCTTFPFCQGKVTVNWFSFCQGFSNNQPYCTKLPFYQGKHFSWKKQQCKWFPFCQGSVHSFCQGVVGFCLLTRHHCTFLLSRSGGLLPFDKASLYRGFCLLTRHHCTELLLFVKECLRNLLSRLLPFCQGLQGGCPQ